jgi:hypothetical protein
MKPNFDQDLKLKNNQRTVAAGGPCNWEDGDDWAEIRDATITQGDVVGLSKGSTTVRNGTATTWWLDVRSSSQFAPGPAQPYAVAVVHTTSGETYQYSWPDSSSTPTPTVQLRY